MKKATLIKDKISGNPFAIITGTKGRVQIFGAIGQGQAWAEWARLQPSVENVIASLDVTLITEDDVALNSEYVDSISSFLDEATISQLKTAIDEKVLLVFTETKSDAPKNEEDYEQINELSEEENIDNWPITDVALATIDVAYKQIALNYKAKAFNLDAQRAGILLQVKGARALWDPNMPGGGGWRCPDNTPFGGQFTNRLGRGCTFGAMRRIGRSLAAASLKDIAKGFDDTSNVDLPLLNRAGRTFERVADSRDTRLQEKFRNRAERRARNAAAEKAKKQNKAGKITFRQAYESIGPDGTRRGRVVTAAALTAKRIAGDIADAERVKESRRTQRRAARRAGVATRKTPPPQDVQPDGGLPPSGGTPTPPIKPAPTGGPTRNRREIIAERLRSAAENIVSENPAQTRRAKRRQRRNDASAQGIAPADGIGDDYTAPESPKRAKRGKSPKPSERLRRFTRGESQTRINELREIQREIRGRTPRSTTPRKERAAMRARRRAAALQGELSTLEDYPAFAPPRVNLPPAIRTGVTPDTFTVNSKNKRSKLLEENNKENVDRILRAIPSPIGPSVSSLIEGDEGTARDVALDAHKQWIRGGGWKGLDSLSRWFAHRNGKGYSHDQMRRDVLSPDSDIDDALGDFDKSIQPELKKMYDDWLVSFNDPDQPLGDGQITNMGLVTVRTDTMKTGTRADGSDLFPGYMDTARIIAYATNEPGMPAVYIEDEAAGIAHLLTKDGEHLLSMGRRKDGTMAFFSGSGAAKKLVSGDKKPSLRDRILRRREAEPAQMSQRARRREVQRSASRSGIFFGKTTSGEQWLLGGETVREDYIKRFGPVPDSEIEEDKRIIKANAEVQLAKYYPMFAKVLGIDDPDNAVISEDSMLDYIDSIAVAKPREAAILKNQLHDFLVMDEIISLDAPELVNNLKPSARSRVLAGTKHSRTLISPGGKRWQFTPTKPESKKTKRTIDPRDIVAPISVSVPPPTPVQKVSPTGPSIVRGVGNPSIGIEYDQQSGLYIDRNTGLYVEDLSGLDVDTPEIYKSEVFPDMPVESYPKTRVTPPGVLPSQFVRHAPYSDPDGAGRIIDDPTTLGVSRTFKESIDTYETAKSAATKGRGDSSSDAVARILGRPTTGIIDSPITRVDAADVDSNLGDMTVGQIIAKAREASTQDSVWSEPDLNIWMPDMIPSEAVGTAMFTVAGRPGVGPVGNIRAIDTATGIMPEQPIGTFYLPGRSQKESLLEGVRELNYALQLQHLSDLSANPGARKVKPTTTVGQDELNEAWISASRSLNADLSRAQAEHKDARDELAVNPRNINAQKGYLRSGNQIEMLEEMLREHIMQNPRALEAVKKSVLGNMQFNSAQRNKRIKAQQARMAIGGTRRTGTFDLQPDILDPHGTSNPPLKPRTLDELELLSAQHRSQGLFANPYIDGQQAIDESEIQVLAEIGEIFDAGRTTGTYVGLVGTPYEGVTFDNANKAVLAHIWHSSGHNSLPILATKEELLNAAAGPLTPEGVQPAMFISRGVTGNPAQRLQYITDYLSGDRFIPGEGGQLAGVGDYFSFDPFRWSERHGGSNGSVVGIVTPNMNLVSRVEFDDIYQSKNGAPLYEALWSVYNGLGAPNAPGGVNASHGAQGYFGIQPAQNVVDPRTGLFDPNQIGILEAQIDKMTEVGTPGVLQADGTLAFDESWGPATVEGILARRAKGVPGTPSLTNGFANLLSTPEAQERRAEINAWLGQHLSWFIQLAQMRQDESVGDVAAAKEYNQRLNKAMRTLLYSSSETRMVMMGVDGYFADSIGLSKIDKIGLWEQIQSGGGDRVIILNRSGMILFREPTKYGDWTQDLQRIRSQVPGQNISLGRGWR
jgi:hypothetical protein